MNIKDDKINTGSITFVIIKYAFEVSPTIKELIRFLQENGYVVNILTDRLYRENNFSLERVNIITNCTSSFTDRENFHLLNNSRFIFAVDFLALKYLYGLNLSLSNVVYLSLESTQYISELEKGHALNLLNECTFGIIQSEERMRDFIEFFNGKLKLEFEHLPVSIRPVKVEEKRSSSKIIYSGYLSDWSGLKEFLNLFYASRYTNYFGLTIQGHCIGTEYYVQEIQTLIRGHHNTNIDLGYYSDKEHLRLLNNHNIGIAIYKKSDSSVNWDNLLFSSGKIANYLWTGCAVITNIQHELTAKPPFIFIKDLNDAEGFDKGLRGYLNNPQLYNDESIKLANLYYNLDDYASKILERLYKKNNDELYQKEKEDTYPSAFQLFLLKNNLWVKNHPLKLHLGCGENHLNGYINIDYPPSEHNVMKVRADVYADITKMQLPENSIDEIRLHHVFEHFNRVTALALLMRWQLWLKAGGILHIETPDLAGCAKILASDAPYKRKMAITRHLAGDQSSKWAFHIDHWFAERYETTLSELGFSEIKIKSYTPEKSPSLPNIEVIALKQKNMSNEEMLSVCEKLLWESTVSDKEQPTYLVWKEQLKLAVQGKDIYSHSEENILNKKIHGTISVSLPEINNPSLDYEAYDWNQRERDNWVKAKAVEIPAGSKVLDIGAGTCPYRFLFSHCNYITHDFKKYEGEKLGKIKDYGQIDIASDINNIPLEDKSIDVILCTEVLEHVPEPIKALEEMSRLLKPGGRLLITAPLGSGLHQLPYHFYGGYTPEWYKHFGKMFNLEVFEIVPNGGFLKLLSQENSRFASTMQLHQHLYGDSIETLKFLFGNWLPKFLYNLDSKCYIDQFTAGYHVEFKKEENIKLLKYSEERENQSGYDSAESRNPVTAALDRNKVAGIIFSRNRSMQLRSLLESFYLNCTDPQNISLKVIYAADEKFLNQYKLLSIEFPGVNFIFEQNFKNQLIDSTAGSEYLLFLVDDNIFIRKFSINQLCSELKNIPESIGFSLRLGKNTNYCYPKNCTQKLPIFRKINSEFLSFNWVSADLDFNYPLEVSSSLYRTEEILPVIKNGNYINPNTLEGLFNEVKIFYQDHRPLLLCPEKSISFCIPINKVQDEIFNRSGNNSDYNLENLADLFDNGKKINITPLQGYIPNACHQEINISFIKTKLGSLSASSAGVKEPLVTIYTVAYNTEKYISPAIESVLNQSFKDFEYVIVDDGSTDGTSSRIEKYIDPRIKFFRREHRNFASEMNFVIQNASGKYILGVDSDDFIDQYYLEKILEAAFRHPEADYIYPERFFIINEQNKITDDKAMFEDFSGDKNRLLLRKLFREAIGRVPNPGSLKKKSIYKKTGLYEELETVEDFVFLSKHALDLEFHLAKGVTGYYYRSIPSGNSQRFLIRGRIMADAVFNMAVKYSPQLLHPGIRTIKNQDQGTEYLKFICNVFESHAEFYRGKGGEYFKAYVDQIKGQIDIINKVEAV